jgi:trehalose 6-phosphate synthase
MKQILIIFLGGALAVSAIALGFTYLQAYEERAALEADLQYRTLILADSLVESVQPAVRADATSSVQRLVDRFGDRERVAGLLVIDSNGAAIAGSQVLPAMISGETPFVAAAMDSDASQSAFGRDDTGTYFMSATPMHDERGAVIGALVLFQSADYINESVSGIWRSNFLRLFLQLLLFFGAVVILVRWIILNPIHKLEESIRSARAEGGTVPASEHGTFFRPIVHEITKLSQSLLAARSAASEEARLRLEQIDTAWTSERLKGFVKSYIKGRPIYVVSHREPYVHEKVGKDIKVSVPAGGVVTALESVMAACGGTWIAYASGDADKETADEDGKIAVPPDEPTYTLRRVWADEEDHRGFYAGFANEALWPLCHMVHNRPIFRTDDWTAYRTINGLFAETILNEIRDVERPVILVQDYHFALLPRMIKNARPDAQVGIFWHIPWPAAEQFSICPWRKEILDGLLGADVVGFHTQQYCNNFTETVAKEIESLIDYEHFTITREGHTSHIEAFPISIAFTEGNEFVDDGAEKRALEALGVSSEFVGLGVERLDYTKGILERFKAIEFFFDEHPDYCERFTFLQIAAPSRESVQKYRDYAEAVESEAERINARFATRSWKPIHFEHRSFTHAELQPLYRAANVCLVTSLHDGMNLVAKEFVAARDDEGGVLVLSQFTGASRDLSGAIIVNPYSAEETAAAIHEALTMSAAKQHVRMKSMRQTLRDYNIYRWSAEFLRAVARLS